jgi:hypothetical protein
MAKKENAAAEKKPEFTPKQKKFILEILEEHSPEKIFEEAYRLRGEPVPPWLAEKIAEKKSGKKSAVVK